jgi:hypothetical protein
MEVLGIIELISASSDGKTVFQPRAPNLSDEDLGIGFKTFNEGFTDGFNSITLGSGSV